MQPMSTSRRVRQAPGSTLVQKTEVMSIFMAIVLVPCTVSQLPIEHLQIEHG